MTELFAIASIALNIGLRFAFPYYVSRTLRLPWLNFVTLPLLASIPVELLRLVGGPMFLIDGGITAPSYQTWLLIENTSLAVSLILMLSIFYAVFLIPQSYAVTPKENEPSQSVMLAALIFLLAGVAGFIITASLGYGILNWIISPRTGYQYYRDSVGPFYALMTSCFSIGSFLALLAIRKNRILFILTVAAVFPLGYLSGSKGVLLVLFIMAIQIYLFTFKRIPVVVLLIAIIPVAALMLIQFGSLDLVDVFNYFDYYYNTSLVYDALSHNHLSFFNGYVSLSEFWGLVPRGLYPDKPYVYGGVILSDLIYPGIAAQGHTVGFGGPINAYSDYGLLGVLIGALFSPIQWATAIFYGFIAKAILTGREEDIRTQPNLVIIFFFLIDYLALGYFAFPLNIVCLIVMWTVLTLSKNFKLGIKRVGKEIQQLPSEAKSVAG